MRQVGDVLHGLSVEFCEVLTPKLDRSHQKLFRATAIFSDNNIIFGTKGRSESRVIEAEATQEVAQLQKFPGRSPAWSPEAGGAPLTAVGGVPTVRP